VYEINPAIRDLARERFTYLEECPTTVEVVMGDARLSMDRELAAGQPQDFDLLALDAFSSDAIPVHLLTREAFEIYLGHLAPEGILAIHISNRYLDLAPVVERLADHFDLAVVSVSDSGGDEWWVYSSTWMLLSRDGRVLEREPIVEASDPCGKGAGHPLWSDDFASVWTILVP
jgi:spermidine synthase